MPVKTVHSDFELLKNKVATYFGDDDSAIKLMVPPEKQQGEINLLKETVGNERFFFVIDLLRFEVEEVQGIQKWLGYSEKEFSLKQYWNQLMHPGQKISLLLIARRMYESLCRGAYPLQFMVQRFASLVTVKHYNGRYLLTKKTASVFQYDSKNRLIAYLNEFTIIGNYEGEALYPRIYNSYGERETVREKEILEKTTKDFLKMKVFTAGELQAIRKLAYNPGITQSKIAEELDLSVHTIETYDKRFLHKAREFYREEFLSVLDAAIHLRKEGLL